MLRQLALSAVVVLATACGSVHDQVNKALLDPTRQWLVDPSAIGLDFEAFELESSKGSLTGWFIPATKSGAGTVLLFHDNSTNISMLHPYYSFLVAAGLNVCVFDYRGFGHSQGDANLRSAFYETPRVVDWLHQRPEVDPDRIAYYGIAFGSTVALNVALRDPCRALVLENAPSLLDTLYTSPQVQESQSPGFRAGLLSLGLPDGVEPSESSSKLFVPSLWIAGADEPRDELRQTLRAYYEMGGDKQLWMLPDTGHAPHSLLTHDGEYQRIVSRFLQSTLLGKPNHVRVAWQPEMHNQSFDADWSVSLRRAGDAKNPWAIQVCALDAAGKPTFENTWLEGSASSVNMKLTNKPQVIGAMHLDAVERTGETSFRRIDSSLSRGGRWYEENAEQFDQLRHGQQQALEQVRGLAKRITEREELESFPPLLEAQLADIYAIVGRILANSSNAEDRASGLIWLQRAVAAVPKNPKLHYWPGRTLVSGFPQQAEVDRARQLLNERSVR